jgi:hypothetical protein
MGGGSRKDRKHEKKRETVSTESSGKYYSSTTKRKVPRKREASDTRTLMRIFIFLYFFLKKSETQIRTWTARAKMQRKR